MSDEKGAFREDHNRTRKMDAVRSLQQLLQYAIQPSFTGFVGVKIHATDGRLEKIIKFNEEHDRIMLDNS